MHMRGFPTYQRYIFCNQFRDVICLSMDAKGLPDKPFHDHLDIGEFQIMLDFQFHSTFLCSEIL